MSALEKIINRGNWYKDTEQDNEVDERWEWCSIDAPPLDEAATELERLNNSSKGWLWICVCNYENNAPICTHCGRNVQEIFSQLRDSHELLEKELAYQEGTVLPRLRTEMQQAKQRIVELIKDRGRSINVENLALENDQLRADLNSVDQETDQFNAGVDDFNKGVRIEDEPYFEEDHDVWKMGWVWQKYITENYKSTITAQPVENSEG